MVRAIVFDCFGVLASEKLTPFCEKYFGATSQQAAEVRVLVRQTTSGVLAYADFIRQVAALADLSERAVREQIEGNVPNAALLDFIAARLKPTYKIGLLSNAARNRLSELFTTSQLALFDATGLSYEIGASKPDIIAYKTIADRLGVELGECLFVDDQLQYCEGAIAAGMQAILYENYDGFCAVIQSM